MAAGDDAGVDDLADDERLDVAAKLGAVLGRGRLVIRRVGVGDDSLVDGRVHGEGRSLPDEDRVAVLPVMLPEGFPERSASRVGRRDAKQERAGDGRHRGTDRVDDLDVGVRASSVGQNATSSRIAAQTV